MSKGQKYNDDVKERAWAMFSVYGNLSYISRRLGVPRSTLGGWKQEYERESRDNSVLAKLRQLKKEEFIVRAWQAVNLSQTILERRLERAVESEKQIDELLELVESISKDAKLNEKTRNELIAKISALKCEDIGRLTQVIGTLYDKQALASCEPTEIVDGSAVIRKFEDFDKEDGTTDADGG